MGKKKVKKHRVERTRGAGKYTESEYFSRIRMFLRDAFRYWPPMQLALKLASRKNQSSNKKLRFEYQCSKCKNWFPRNEVEIDHVKECGSLKTYADIVPFIQRLTPESPDAFQILCKHNCHKEKTNEFLKTKKNGVS